MEMLSVWFLDFHLELFSTISMTLFPKQQITLVILMSSSFSEHWSHHTERSFTTETSVITPI